jgi:hypothetical protein
VRDATRGGCRPLPQTRPTPTRHRRQAVAPGRVRLLPVSSPLLRESSLFLAVLRCFSSRSSPPGRPGCPGVPRAGCPIRIPPDPRLPAPPRSISPRGRVLLRPPAPRHPPCARHAEAHSNSVPEQPSQAAPDRRAPARTSPSLRARRPAPAKRIVQTEPARPLRSMRIYSAWLGSQNLCRTQSIKLRAVRAGDRARNDAQGLLALDERRPFSPTAAEPGGSRVAHCQGAAGIDK